MIQEPSIKDDSGTQYKERAWCLVALILLFFASPMKQSVGTARRKFEIRFLMLAGLGFRVPLRH